MLLHIATGALTLRFAWPRAQPRRQQEIAVRWARELLAILAVRVRAEGHSPPSGAGAMLASNHVSWIDVFAIASVRHTRFIAKSEIRDWPIVGWLSQGSGTIFIRRARRLDTARINAIVHDALAEGDCVGLFPEGTTTEGDRLLKFHSSLFEPAVANRARVFPVAVRYENPDGSRSRSAPFVGETTFMQSVALVVRSRETIARIAFAAPIEPDALTRQAVALEAHRRVAELLGVPPVPSATGTRAGPTAGSR